MKSFKHLLLISALSALSALSAVNPSAADRPNLVFIVSEDNSVHYLNHFFPGGTKAPNIEALAKDGITFDHAFSNAPVCSVARTTLATGCLAPRIGTQFHRRYEMAAMPKGLKMWAAYLREAGYYTTNNSKEDYNAIKSDDVWDDSSKNASWRNRPDKKQPFYHMASHGESHEGRLQFSQETYENVKTAHDPASVKLADYFPDTPLFRYTHAHYLDCMTTIDGIVGDTVAKLKEDGLLEDTFIFYFGDHGGVMPRSKGYAYQSGLHVPLVVRVPENFQKLSPFERGEHARGFVSFIDFGPTALNLADLDIPDQIDGTPFLGKSINKRQVESRNEVYGYADRFDEKYDLIRTIRVGKYHYMRSYQPWLPDGLQNNYRYRMLAYTQWRDLYKAGELEGAQAQFFQPRPAELLFDVEADPHEVNDLSSDPNHEKTLKSLRAKLNQKLKNLPDLSIYPESYLAANAMGDAVTFGQEHKREIATLVDTADLALLPFDKAKLKIEKALASSHWAVRYWAAMACTSFGKEAKNLAKNVKPLLEDEKEIVRVRAAEFLGRLGTINPQETLVKIVNTTEDPIVATEALNSVVYFKDFFDDKYPVDRSDFTPVADGADIDDRLNYINGVPYPARTKKKK